MITKPKGCHDIYGIEGKKWQYVSNLIDGVCDKYNYSFIRTPIFESTELFHRGVGETSDIVSKETYDFIDRGDRKMTLRPEGTAGVVRSYIENKMYGDATQPVKLYYNGTMYRYERPQSGRDRELTQFGMEVIGSDDPFTDAEIISMAVNIYRLVGLKGIKVNINSLGDLESRSKYREALVNYFKPHVDELCDDCKNRLEKNPLRVLDCKVDNHLQIMKDAPRILDYLNEDSKNRFEAVKKYLGLMDIEYIVNPNVVRGLDYYCHTVFEIEADIKDFGSQNVLGAGGRYNGLAKELGGPDVSGVGFAMGIGRLMLAIEKEGIELPINTKLDAFVMYVSDTEKDYAATLVQELRMSGFRIDTEYTGRGLKGQFKQADRLNSKYLIILNDSDLENNLITVKNNTTKEEVKIEIDYLLYYLDECLISEDDHNHDGCDCGCEDEDDHNCNCGDDCDCGDDCNCGNDCDCGDDCSCNHN
ncbi:MAG: histidine--tRNA ligase [Bacilli bacterium]|nr:histidine--tRNA ligase [Bacilli bacterium]